MRVQVGIVGAGPAGLFLAELLARAGIETAIVETRSREYCEQRIRAGLLERHSVDLIRALGRGERMDREGMVHHGLSLRHRGETHYLAYDPGVSMTIYGQQEVVKDFIAARLRGGTSIAFEVDAVSVHDLESERPQVHYRDARGNPALLDCDFIAGCDGFHGITRSSIPDGVLRFFDRQYPFAWLGILAAAPPLDHEGMYVKGEEGFALFTMRSPTLSRNYIQVPLGDAIEAWSDDRIWSEMSQRLAGDDRLALASGEILQKSVTDLRSFVAAPMQFGRLFLAGDAAHIVPPTGAKGMNLAIGDVAALSERLIDFYRTGDRSGLDAYSDIALRRVWKAQRFSWWMTALLHRFDDHQPFDRELQLAELDYLLSSSAATQTLTENYTGLPFEWRGLGWGAAVTPTAP